MRQEREKESVVVSSRVHWQADSEYYRSALAVALLSTSSILRHLHMRFYDTAVFVRFLDSVAGAFREVNAATQHPLRPQPHLESREDCGNDVRLRLVVENHCWPVAETLSAILCGHTGNAEVVTHCVSESDSMHDSRRCGSRRESNRSREAIGGADTAGIATAAAAHATAPRRVLGRVDPARVPTRADICPAFVKGSLQGR
jgi:hypothetical protein